MSVYDRRTQEALAYSLQEVIRAVKAGTSPQVAVVQVIEDILKRKLLTLPLDLSREEFSDWHKYLLSVAEETHAKKRLPRPMISYEPLLGLDVATGEKVTMSIEELNRGLAVFGGTGSGKTTQVSSLFLQHVNAGGSGVYFDADGDSISQTLPHIAQSRMGAVVLFDFTDTSRFIGLNPLAGLNSRTSVTRFLEDCRKLWKIGPETPNLVNTLQATILTLSLNNLTVSEIPILLRDKEFRARCMKAIPRTLDGDWLRWFWEKDYTSRYQGGATDRADSTLNKIVQLLTLPQTSYILSQSKTTVPFRHLLEDKIVLVNLGVSTLGEDAVKFITTFLISELKAAIFSQGDTPLRERVKFLFVADEWHLYKTPDFIDLFTRGRRFGACTIAITQTISQVEEAMREPVMQVANKQAFRSTAKDAHELAPYMAQHKKDEHIEEKEIPLPPARPAAWILDRNTTLGDERVYSFVYCWMEKYRLSRESKGNAVVGGGEYSKFVRGIGFRTVKKQSQPNPHYSEVVAARKEIELLDDFLSQVITKNLYSVFPLPLLFHLFAVYGAACFDAEACDKWRENQFSKHPPRDYCSFLYDLLHGQDIIYSNYYGYSIKKRAHAFSEEELTKLYERLFTAATEQELTRAFAEYEAFVRPILTLDIKDFSQQWHIKGRSFIIYTPDTDVKSEYERNLRAWFNDSRLTQGTTIERLMACFPFENVTFDTTTPESGYKEWKEWRIKAYPETLLTALMQEIVEQVIQTGKASFERIIREVRFVAYSLHADPPLAPSGKYETVVTYTRSVSDMVKEMEENLIGLPDARCYVSFGTRGEAAKLLDTISYERIEGANPLSFAAQEEIARRNTLFYTLPREEIQQDVYARRAAFGLETPSDGAPSRTTVREEKPAKDTATHSPTPAGHTNTNADRIVEAGTPAIHPLMSLPEEPTPETYLVLLYYFSNLTLKQAVRLAGLDENDKNIQRKEQSKINRLIGAGLVETVPSEDTTFLISGGRAPLVYRLTKSGYDKLHKEKGLKPISQGGFSPHSYKVVEVTISLLQAIRETKYSLVDFCSDKMFRSFKPIKLAGGRELEPDCWLLLRVNGKVHSIFLEVDRRTEGSSSLKDKLKRYSSAIETKAHQGFTTEKVAIVFINPNGKPIDAPRMVGIIEDAINEGKVAAKYASLFLVASVTLEEISPLELITKALFKKPNTSSLFPLL